MQRNEILNCIDLPAEEFRYLFVIPYEIQPSETLSRYIEEVKETWGYPSKIEVPGGEYWQSLLKGIVLRPFQIEFLQWAESRRILAYPPKGSQTGVICSLDQGCGKTITALCADAHFRKVGLVKKTLVVCRMNNKYSTWVKHIEDYTKLQHVVIGGNKRERLRGLKQLNNKKTDVGIIHYEAMRLHEEELSKGIDCLIIDECQAIANHESKQSQVAGAIAQGVKVILMLSGGVVQNRVATQLFHPLHLCDGKAWPSFQVWKRDWCILDEIWVPLYVRGKKVVDPRTHEPVRRRIHKIAGIRDREKLSREIAPYLYQRSKEQVTLQLPPKIYQVVETGLYKEQLKLYREIKEAVENEVRGVSIPIALTKVLRLVQVCATLDCFDMGDISRKADEASNMIFEILPEGQDALVFSKFVPMCHSVYRRLKKMEMGVFLLTGKEPKTTEEKEEVRRRFKEEGQVLVTTIQMEGTGSDYPKASYVFRLDRDYRPLVNLQAEDRAHRLTSTYTVLNIIDFVTRESIEQEHMEILKEKATAIKDVMDLAKAYTMGDIARMLAANPKTEW